MKKIALMFVACVMCVATFANNKIIVQNAEKVSVYDDITTAMREVVAGDTLYLSDGSYDAFTLNKLLYLRGTGNTAIAGNLTIDIGANPSPTDALIEGLKIEGTLSIVKKITNLIIRQCQMNDFSCSEVLTNALMDRCCVNNFFYNANTGGWVVRNSYIRRYQGSEPNCTLINCDIYGMQTYIDGYYPYADGIFKNCNILGCWSVDTHYTHRYEDQICGTFIYCYFAWNLSSYPLNAGASVSNKVASSDGFGDDGTKVGYMGGTTPYDLNPAVPQVSSASIDVDQVNKKLKIQLEVVAE